MTVEIVTWMTTRHGTPTLLTDTVTTTTAHTTSSSTFHLEKDLNKKNKNKKKPHKNNHDDNDVNAYAVLSRPFSSRAPTQYVVASSSSSLSRRPRCSRNQQPPRRFHLHPQVPQPSSIQPQIHHPPRPSAVATATILATTTTRSSRSNSYSSTNMKCVRFQFSIDPAHTTTTTNNVEPSRVHDYPEQECYPQDASHMLWWTADELRAIRQHCAETVHKLARNRSFLWAWSILCQYQDLNWNPARAEQLWSVSSSAGAGQLHPSVLSPVLALSWNDYDSVALERASQILLSCWENDEARGLEQMVILQQQQQEQQQLEQQHQLQHCSSCSSSLCVDGDAAGLFRSTRSAYSSSLGPSIQEHRQRVLALFQKANARMPKKHNNNDQQQHGNKEDDKDDEVDEDGGQDVSSSSWGSSNTDYSGSSQSTCQSMYAASNDDAVNGYSYSLRQQSRKMTRPRCRLAAALAKFDAHQA
ncbi:hypothetical protein ACA910_002718 [Epithemia clementina (nom. ined.)]